MKILDYWKNFKFTSKKKANKSITKLEHNKMIMNGVNVFEYKLHSEAYRLLRKFKTPQYKTIYSMRKKKAFNTFYFIQNYDVVITDKNGLVIDIYSNLKPGYTSDVYETGYSIYFMTVGSIKYFDIKKKDMIKILRLSQWY